MESQKQIRYGIFTNHLPSSSYQGCYWMTFYAIAWYCHCVPNFLKKVMNRMSKFFVNYKTMLFQKAFLVWSGLVFNQVWIFTDLAAMYFQIRIFVVEWPVFGSITYFKLTFKYIFLDEWYGQNEHGTIPEWRGMVQADDTDN